MVPTELGVALIDAFEQTEAIQALARPDIRAKMEQQVSLIAGLDDDSRSRSHSNKNAADDDADDDDDDDDDAVLRYKKMVVDLNLALFLERYTAFAASMHKVRPLFISEQAALGLTSASATGGYGVGLEDGAAIGGGGGGGRAGSTSSRGRGRAQVEGRAEVEVVRRGRGRPRAVRERRPVRGRPRAACL